MDKLEYLFAANLFVWGGILTYLFSLMKRSSALEKDLELLKKNLDQGK